MLNPPPAAVTPEPSTVGATPRSGPAAYSVTVASEIGPLPVFTAQSGSWVSRRQDFEQLLGCRCSMMEIVRNHTHAKTQRGF